MKYCLNYNRDTERANHIQDADEWIIKYNSKDTTLLEFLDLHKDKRINIYFEEEIKREEIEFSDEDMAKIKKILNEMNF